MIHKKKIAVIGQGYVGLPLAVAFSRFFSVVGFDIKEDRIKQLKNYRDTTNEVSEEILRKLLTQKPGISDAGLCFSNNIEDIKDCTIYIVTVPTPIDEFNAPNLKPLMRASEMLGKILKEKDIVIYESTVYPGCTEEDCVPILQHHSGLRYNIDFFVGYSPERINPGDKINTLETIVKVTSGSTEEVTEEIDQLYKTIVKAGTYRASSIKVAEASKAIENAQRDLNISFVNELALIFDRMNIDTNDVIEAASTKYNFLKFKPGLVGGHCISVDPYYLTHKALQLGYHPDVILSGRRVNNQMPEFIVGKLIKKMIHKNIKVNGSKVLLLGITFKENCPDIRNSKVIEIYEELQEYKVHTDVHDPQADAKEVKEQFGISLLSNIPVATNYDAIILAVAHNEYRNLDISKLKKEQAVIFDVKDVLDRDSVDVRL